MVEAKEGVLLTVITQHNVHGLSKLITVRKIIYRLPRADFNFQYAPNTFPFKKASEQLDLISSITINKDIYIIVDCSITLVSNTEQHNAQTEQLYDLFFCNKEICFTIIQTHLLTMTLWEINNPASNSR